MIFAQFGTTQDGQIDFKIRNGWVRALMPAKVGWRSNFEMVSENPK